MLTHIDVRDIVLIERTALDLGAGLNVFTGETGAGKSILLDALSLALGGRGDGGLVRSGSDHGKVAAVFRLKPSHSAVQLIIDSGLSTPEVEGDGSCEIVLRRIQTCEGPTRAFINDEPVKVGLLRSVGQQLVEIHAQHSARALLEPAAHRVALDAFGNLGDQATETSRAYYQWRALEQQLSCARAEFEQLHRDRDYISYAAKELDQLNPVEGEESELMEQRIAFAASEELENSLRSLADCLNGAQGIAVRVAAWFQRYNRPNSPKMSPAILAGVEQLLSNTDEIIDTIDIELAQSRGDYGSIEVLDNRLSDLHAMARKYRVGVNDLAATRDNYLMQLESLDVAETNLAKLTNQLSEALATYRKCAEILSNQRQLAKGEMCKKLQAEFLPLKLEHVQFEVDLIPADADRPSPHGSETVRFKVATVPGREPQPLGEVVSGGELSRIMLGLMSVLAQANSSISPTLVFDEIDTGVGGAIADAIGARLAAMAGDSQVIAVSHLAQIAARADQHYCIVKSAPADNQTKLRTFIHPLDHETSVEEIARMLSGQAVSDSARKAASQLYNEARAR